jgi:hypothetical protein
MVSEEPLPLVVWPDLLLMPFGLCYENNPDNVGRFCFKLENNDLLICSTGCSSFGSSKLQIDSNLVDADLSSSNVLRQRSVNSP